MPLCLTLYTVKNTYMLTNPDTLNQKYVVYLLSCKHALPAKIIINDELVFTEQLVFTKEKVSCNSFKVYI